MLVTNTRWRQVEAFEAYANREFGTVLQKLADILAADPDNPRWYEMRAQVRLDPKRPQGVWIWIRWPALHNHTGYA